MALQECGLNLNRVSKELQPHGTPDFPCAGYSSYHTGKEEDVIPWHWHEEMEMIYIEQGQMDVKIPSMTFCVDKGGFVAVNSNVLHYGRASESCRLQSLVFSPRLIMGSDDSAFAKKYMLPLLSCSSFSGSFLQADDSGEVVSRFRCAFEALKQDSFGFEFVVRENLSRICLYLYRQFEREIDAQEIVQSQENLRIRTMLAYIHENFSDNIVLADIAKAADIGERECLRCFQKTIQLSPIQYVMKYRIMQGAEMLLKHRTDSISEIATFCGFDSPSNFAKVFKRFYSCTPREYRNSQPVSRQNAAGGEESV